MTRYHTLNDVERSRLELAHRMAKRSLDPSTKVGAVLSGGPTPSIHVGWNRFPYGMTNRTEWWTNREEKLDRVVHAEMVALLSAGSDAVGATCYCTGMPCTRCMVHLLQAGVRRFVAPEFTEAAGPTFHRWKDSVARSIQYAREAGAQVLEVDPAEWPRP